MIKSDRRARMMLGCAMDGGDPAVDDLVQSLGAEGAWAKITEGALGEPAAERAARVSVDAGQNPAPPAWPAPRSGLPWRSAPQAGLMRWRCRRGSHRVARSAAQRSMGPDRGGSCREVPLPAGTP